jgi:hypothetical protein
MAGDAGLQLRRLGEVEGVELGELDEPLSRAGPNALRRLLVQPGALLARQGGVGDVADQLVAKCVVTGAGGDQLLHQGLALERVQRLARL